MTIIMTIGSENEGNINGLEYLQENEIYMREAAKQILIPLRKYMWWDSEVCRARMANTRMGEMMGKIVRLHKEGIIYRRRLCL
jgi:hypothetical protein